MKTQVYHIRDKKLLFTGAYGFLGRAVVGALKRQKIKPICIRRSQFDLTKETEVESMFQTHQPQVVFHLAGLVGGILPNKERPAE